MTKPARNIFLLFVLAAWMAAADQVTLDQWFVGRLNGQPALQAHARVVRHEDGSSSDGMETVVLIARKLGTETIRFEISEAQRYEVDAQGRIRSFRFDHVENGTVTAATGRVEDREVVATVLRLGRSETTRIPLPPGQELLGQQAGQERLAARSWKAGDKDVFAQLALLNGQVLVVQTTAAFKTTDAQDRLVFDVVMDAMPLPMGMTITRKGDLAGMRMDMGIFAIDIVPSAGPVKLAGAELDAVNLVNAAGPAPGPGPVNRFRLPAGAMVASDEFQRQDGQVVTVLDESAPQPLMDPRIYLGKEAQLETDDAALRAWVEGLAKNQKKDGELVELLRLAVRSHITTKDLSQGDASALETFRTQRGDCTEHANLLCAALRIAGFPARVEVGVVFSPVHGGWVGHAWNSAYIGDGGAGLPTGRWIHLDSAYPGIARSSYLKLGTTSGGAWTATGAALIGNLGTLAGKTVEFLP